MFFLAQIPNGVYPTMITPFTDDNKIDYNGVEALLEWYHKKGVDGIFAICQSSEIFYLSFEERLELLKFIMKHKPSDMAVVASGHTADDFSVQLEEAKAFSQQGIDAYVFISNRFASEDESEDVLLEKMFTAADSLPGSGFGVYECPYPYKRELTPYVLKEMARDGRFLFLKDTCCSTQKLKEKLDAVKGSDLKIYNANAATLLESLKMGCSGYSGVMGNFHPELYSELIKALSEGNIERAELLQNIVGYFSITECQYYPVNAKYYLSLDGVNIGINTRTKSPDGFTESKRLEIEQMYKFTQAVKEKLL